MNWLNLSKIFQIIIAVFLIFLVLIQSKNTGLAAGIKSSFSMYRSLRGVEKLVFIFTIISGVLLVLNSILLILLM